MHQPAILGKDDLNGEWLKICHHVYEGNMHKTGAEKCDPDLFVE
jgi:hypothetical protein